MNIGYLLIFLMKSTHKRRSVGKRPSDNIMRQCHLRDEQTVD